jgi:hypothetical protein
LDDAEGASAVRALGVMALPVVTKGDAYAAGFDLAEIDAVVGLQRDGDDLLPGGELAARSRAMLAAAARYTRQLPPEHHDDVIPGMEGVTGPLVMPDGTVLRFPDGTPFMPHRTALGLVRHIVGHGVKWYAMAEDPDIDISHIAVFGMLGEPLEDVSVDWLVDQLEVGADRIGRWWDTTSGRDLPRVMHTYSGPMPLHHMLQAMTVSLTQHTRQLMTILVDLGIEPDGPLSEKDYRGLHIPAGVWE